MVYRRTMSRIVYCANWGCQLVRSPKQSELLLGWLNCIEISSYWLGFLLWLGQKPCNQTPKRYRRPELQTGYSTKANDCWVYALRWRIISWKRDEKDSIDMRQDFPSARFCLFTNCYRRGNYAVGLGEVASAGEILYDPDLTIGHSRGDGNK